MKKCYLILIALVSFTTANAQKGVYVGLKGAFNSTWLFNKSVSDAGDELDYKTSFGSQFGICSRFNFNDNSGVVLEVLMGRVNQKYTNRLIVGNTTLSTFETENKMKTIDIPVLYRYTFVKGAYFEVGPQFSIISEFKTEVPEGSMKLDKKYLNSPYFAADLGFGYSIGLTDNLALDAGLRFSWGLSDISKKQSGEQNHEATNAAVGGVNVGLTYFLGEK